MEHEWLTNYTNHGVFVITQQNRWKTFDRNDVSITTFICRIPDEAMEERSQMTDKGERTMQKSASSLHSRKVLEATSETLKVYSHKDHFIWTVGKQAETNKLDT